MSDKCLQQSRPWCSCLDSESRTSPMKPFFVFFAQIVFLFHSEEIIHSCCIQSGWQKYLQRALLTGQGDPSRLRGNSELLIQQMIVSQGRVWVFLSLFALMKSSWQESAPSVGEVFTETTREISHSTAKDSQGFSQQVTVDKLMGTRRSHAIGEHKRLMRLCSVQSRRVQRDHRRLLQLLSEVSASTFNVRVHDKLMLIFTYWSMRRTCGSVPESRHNLCCHL